MGIFFRKPKTGGSPSAADECRMQNSDTSKIRWIPNCINNRTSTVPLCRPAEKILDLRRSLHVHTAKQHSIAEV